MRSRQPFLENIIWAEMLISTNRLPMGMAEGRTDIHEIRLMGLILAQSIGVGFAIALFDAGIWLNEESVYVNGLTWGMGALAVQVFGMYTFKMFLEGGMQERASFSHMQKEQSGRMRQMQMEFERRQQDMQMKQQEAQFEHRLRWMEQNPNVPYPGDMEIGMPQYATSGYYGQEGMMAPEHYAHVEQPLDLGAKGEDEKKTAKRGADGKFAKKE